MPYITINNFKFGLDGRRSELSAIQGTLLDATDGHITQGGSFEKRKAFIQLNSTTRPANTYGLEVTSTGLVVFGSFAPTGGNGVGAAVAGTTLYNFSAYANVYYQQLIHPSSLFGNVAPPAMTALLCSTSFGGKTWAAAKFADGYVYLFYNGVPIPGSYNGLILTGVTSNQYIATQLATYIATITGFSVGAVTAGGGGSYYFDMWSTSGLQYGLTVQAASGNAGSGTINNTNISNYIAGVTGQAATSKFQIVGGSFYKGANTSGIAAIQVKVSGVWTEILGVATYFLASDTTATFANNIVAQIAAYSSTINVTAIASNNTITLYFPISQGITPNGDNIRIQTYGDCCIDNTVFSFASNATLTAGTTITSVQIPAQTNIVPAVNYSGGGSYTLTGLTIGVNYNWIQGTNDTSCVNGTQTLTNSGFFTAQGTTVTLHGTNSTSITAAVIQFVEILGSTITSGVVISAWLAATAAAIRAYCLANAIGATAFASGTNLFISHTSLDSSAANGNQALISTGVNAVIVSDGSGLNTLSDTPIVLVISPNPPTYQITNGFVSNSYSVPVTAAVIGGTAPFQFSWTSSSSDSRITLNVPPNPFVANQVTVSGTITADNEPNPTVSSTLTCSVVDALGLQQTAVVVFTLFKAGFV